jgi:copper(I)-binding protein
MKRRTFLLAAVSCAMLPTLPAVAQDASAGGLTITQGFARSSPMMANAGAGFLTITNAGAADRLLAFKTEACEQPELHTHIEQDGMMAMRKVDAIDVPANSQTVLAPGGLHLMFIGLKSPLQEGGQVAVTLVFEKAGEIAVSLPVKGPGAMN